MTHTIGDPQWVLADGCTPDAIQLRFLVNAAGTIIVRADNKLTSKPATDLSAESGESMLAALAQADKLKERSIDGVPKLL